MAMIYHGVFRRGKVTSYYFVIHGSVILVATQASYQPYWGASNTTKKKRERERRKQEINPILN